MNKDSKLIKVVVWGLIGSTIFTAFLALIYSVI